jgi:hypothetical protein
MQRGPVRGADGTVLRGYGPLAAVVALVLAMAFLSPTVAPERVVVTPAGPAPAVPATFDDGTRP